LYHFGSAPPIPNWVILGNKKSYQEIALLVVIWPHLAHIGKAVKKKNYPDKL
jgi:hypothetical protein